MFLQLTIATMILSPLLYFIPKLIKPKPKPHFGLYHPIDDNYYDLWNDETDDDSYLLSYTKTEMTMSVNSFDSL